MEIKTTTDVILTIIAIVTVINTIGRWVGKSDGSFVHMVEEQKRQQAATHALANKLNEIPYHFVQKKDFHEEMSRVWASLDNKQGKK